MVVHAQRTTVKKGIANITLAWYGGLSVIHLARKTSAYMSKKVYMVNVYVVDYITYMLVR